MFVKMLRGVEETLAIAQSMSSNLLDVAFKRCSAKEVAWWPWSIISIWYSCYGNDFTQTSLNKSVLLLKREIWRNILYWASSVLIPQWECPSYSRSTCDKFVLCSSSWSSSPPSPSPPPPPSPSFPSSLPGSPYFYFQKNPMEKTLSLANQKETTFILAMVSDFLSPIPDKRKVLK